MKSWGLGAAILAQEEREQNSARKYRGDDFILEGEFKSTSHECKGCPNLCEVVCIKRNQEILAYWGDRCKKWENSINRQDKLQVI